MGGTRDLAGQFSIQIPIEFTTCKLLTKTLYVLFLKHIAIGKYIREQHVGINMAKSNISPKERSCYKILHSIALNGESTQYELKASTELTYAPIHEAIKVLLASNLIHETRQETFRVPLPKRFFGLTLKGLAWTILLTAKIPQDLNKIAEKWGRLLPLALGKWKYFAAANLQKEFIEAFIWVAKWILDWGYNTKEFATERFWYFIFQMTAGATKVKWLRTLRGDPDLRPWAIEEMKEWLAEGRVFMKIHERSLEVLEMPSEPDWTKVVNDLRFHAPKESKYSRPLSDEEVSHFLE